MNVHLNRRVKSITIERTESKISFRRSVINNLPTSDYFRYIFVLQKPVLIFGLERWGEQLTKKMVNKNTITKDDLYVDMMISFEIQLWLRFITNRFER